MTSRPAFAPVARALRSDRADMRATLALGSLPIIGALLLLALILR
jgi:hypothetical protein